LGHSTVSSNRKRLLSNNYSKSISQVFFFYFPPRNEAKHRQKCISEDKTQQHHANGVWLTQFHAPTNDYDGFFCISELPDIDDDDNDDDEEQGEGGRSIDDEVAAAADDVAGFMANDEGATITAADGANTVSADEPTIQSYSGLYPDKTRKNRKRLRKKEYEDEGDDERIATKVSGRRWSPEEISKLFKKFGKQITVKKMPTGQQISEFAKLISYSRTVAQIRTQVHNIINGKIKCFK
jgi:hypothetical protein